MLDEKLFKPFDHLLDPLLLRLGDLFFQLQPLVVLQIFQVLVPDESDRIFRIRLTLSFQIRLHVLVIIGLRPNFALDHGTEEEKDLPESSIRELEHPG